MFTLQLQADRESSPVTDGCSTTVPRNQPTVSNSESQIIYYCFGFFWLMHNIICMVTAQSAATTLLYLLQGFMLLIQQQKMHFHGHYLNCRSLNKTDQSMVMAIVTLVASVMPAAAAMLHQFSCCPFPFNYVK